MQVSFQEGEVIALKDIQNAIAMCGAVSGYVELKTERGRTIKVSPSIPPNPVGDLRPQGEQVDGPKSA